MFSRLQNTLGAVAMVMSCSSAIYAEDSQLCQDEQSSQKFECENQWEDNSQYCFDWCGSQWNFELSGGVLLSALCSDLRADIPQFSISGVDILTWPTFNWDWNTGYYLDGRAFNCQNWGVGVSYFSNSFSLSDSYNLRSAIPEIFSDPIKLKLNCDYCVFDAFWISQMDLGNCIELNGFAGLRFGKVKFDSDESFGDDVEGIRFYRNVKYDIFGLRAGGEWHQQFNDCFQLRLQLAATIGKADVERKIVVQETGIRRAIQNEESGDLSSDSIGMLGFDGEIGGRYNLQLLGQPTFMDLSFYAQGWNPMSKIETNFRNGFDNGFMLYGIKVGLGITF